MKLKTVVLLMLLSLFGPFANADEVSHRAAAEELLLITNVDEMLKPIMEQMKEIIEQQFIQRGASEEDRPILNRYINELIKIVEKEFSWEETKDDYIAIYTKTYTEEEIHAITEFYKSPAGKKLIETMPQLMQESMAISQKKMPTLMKKMQEISEKMVNEINQSNKQQK